MSASLLIRALDPARLVSGDALFEALSPAVSDASATLAGVRARYLRLKPGRSALLGLELTWRTDGGERTTLASLYVGAEAASAAAKARTLRLLEPAIGPAVAELPSLPGLLLGFPNDRVLKGLSAAADARRLGNRLTAPGTAWAAAGWRVSARRTRVTPVRWKPARRAVLSADLVLRRDATDEVANERVWVRVHAAGERAARDAGWLAAAAVPGLIVPAVRWSDAERGLLVTAHVDGRGFDDASGAHAWSALGDALAALWPTPVAGLARRDDRDEARAAVAALDALARVAPSFGARAAELRARLERAMVSLPACVPGFVHGDLAADQVLVRGDGVALLDWDEAAIGDPHADVAALAADLAARGDGSGDALRRIEALLSRALGAGASSERFAWQLAVAHARRVLAGLQRAESDWESSAERALSRAENALRAARASRPTPASGHPLLALLEPASRRGLPGVHGRDLSLAAVWPAPDGAHARLDDPARPGAPALWLAIGPEGVHAHAFPDDPALPTLARWIADGHTVAGHRLGRRAALRSGDGAWFVHLRPEATAARATARVLAAQSVLAGAGVPHAESEAIEGGWRSRAVRGRAWPAGVPSDAAWRAAGEQLARAHATGRAGEASDGLPGVLRAGAAQIALVATVDDVLARALQHDLDAITAAGAGTPAWVHGDLHPGQLVSGPDGAVWIDWERARAGEAEEDLGNLAAHLSWEFGREAHAAWTAFADGYREAGGVWSHRRFVVHALAAMPRVRAIHSWRDAGRVRAIDAAPWRRWRTEVSSW